MFCKMQSKSIEKAEEEHEYFKHRRKKWLKIPLT